MTCLGSTLYIKPFNLFPQKHRNELKDMSIAMESDEGTFTPFGLTYSGTNRTAHCVLHEILKLMAPINATELDLRFEGSDVKKLYNEGVPVTSLDNDRTRYFYYHHTEGDTMTVLSRDELNKCQALWTAVSYALASLDDLLPDGRKAKL